MKVAVPAGVPAIQDIIVSAPSVFRKKGWPSFCAVVSANACIVSACVALGTRSVMAASGAGQVAMNVAAIFIGAVAGVGVGGAGALAVDAAVKNHYWPLQLFTATVAAVVGDHLDVFERVGDAVDWIGDAVEDFLRDGDEQIAEETGDLLQGVAEGPPHVGEGVGDVADATGDAMEAADLPERPEVLLKDGAEQIAKETGDVPQGIARGSPNVGEGVGDVADGTGDAVEASDVPPGTGDLWEDGLDWIDDRGVDGFCDALGDLLIDLF